jgi:RNA polymerase sigma-B factor
VTEEARLEVPEEPEFRVSGDFDGAGAAEITEVTAEVTAIRSSHPVEDRARARALFEQLAELAPADPQRLRLRGVLVEMDLPLVEYLARRFRNRGEWLDDLTQVATIGLI